MILLIIIMCTMLKVILICIQARIMVLMSTRQPTMLVYIQANIIVLVYSWGKNDCVGPGIIALMCTQADIMFIDYSLECNNLQYL